MEQTARHSPELERELLRKSVHALAQGRNACADCGRTPLVGERVHLYESGSLVCDLCRSRHREAPQSSQRVRSAERGHAVRTSRYAA